MEKKRKNVLPAFLCSGGVFAVEILSMLKQRGYQEKTDFGVMGFDNIDVLQKLSPRLTTVNNHVEETGIRAAELLLKMVRGEEHVNSIEIPYDMIEGDTI